MIVIFWFLYFCVGLVAFTVSMALFTWFDKYCEDILHIFFSGIIGLFWPIAFPGVVLYVFGMIIKQGTLKVKGYVCK